MLSNYTAFTQEAQKFRRTRSTAKKLEEKLNNEVQDATATEKEQLEIAMKNYQNKLDQVLSKKRGQINKIEDYHQQMSNTLEKTFEAFQATCQSIQEDSNITDDREKEKRINAIAENITNSLFTKEESEQFKKLAQSMVIVIPSDRLQMSKLHQPEIRDQKARVEYF